MSAIVANFLRGVAFADCAVEGVPYGGRQATLTGMFDGSPGCTARDPNLELQGALGVTGGTASLDGGSVTVHLDVSFDGELYDGGFYDYAGSEVSQCTKTSTSPTYLCGWP